MSLPRDPAILLSYINTQLRDFHSDLDELCLTLGLDKAALVRRPVPSGQKSGLSALQAKKRKGRAFLFLRRSLRAGAGNKPPLCGIPWFNQANEKGAFSGFCLFF